MFQPLLWMNFSSPHLVTLSFWCTTVQMTKDYCMKFPCSWIFHLGGWKTYFICNQNTCVCPYALLGDSYSYTHLGKPLQKYNQTNRPNQNDIKKMVTRTKQPSKTQGVKKRHQCYTVSLKSEYKDIWAAPGSVAVTLLPSPRSTALSGFCRQRSVIIFCLHISEGHLHIKLAFFLQILRTHSPKPS